MSEALTKGPLKRAQSAGLDPLGAHQPEEGNSFFSEPPSTEDRLRVVHQRTEMETPKNTDPDRELVLRCQEATPSGLEGCFRELYDGYKDRVYNVCYRITGNGNDALDAAQE